MLIHRKMPSLQRPMRTQHGAVLVVAIIFLLLLTLLAISASGRSLLQERMAGGLLNAQQAEMSAQTALRGAEWKLWTSSSKIGAPPLICGTGLFTDCYKFDPANPIANVVNFRTQQGFVTTGATQYKGVSGSTNYTAAGSMLASNPYYIIEELGRELPPGASGSLHESGDTGPLGNGPGKSPNRYIYRITARATGGSANTVRVLESTFAAMKN
ncbi:MAG TPA: PilX N-terminal domain-containing pilus assembly protein [Rhodanobacter sp.]